MKVSEIIAALTQQLNQYGDCEVLITDGYQAACYRGNFALQSWTDDAFKMYIDIGIGDCLE